MHYLIPEDVYYGSIGTQWTEGNAIDNVYLGRSTPANETFVGSSQKELFMGAGGSDFIYAYGGNDYLYGGTGNDELTGGTDNDQLFGGSGNDAYVFAAGDGQDVIDDSDGSGYILYDNFVLIGQAEWDEDLSVHKYLFNAGQPNQREFHLGVSGVDLVIVDQSDPANFITLKNFLDNAEQSPYEAERLGITLEDPEDDEDGDDQGGLPQDKISPLLEDVLGLYQQALAVLSQGHDPLVLDLDGDGVELIDQQASHAFFDIDDVNEIFGTLTTPRLCSDSLVICASNDNIQSELLAA